MCGVHTSPENLELFRMIQSREMNDWRIGQTHIESLCYFCNMRSVVAQYRKGLLSVYSISLVNSSATVVMISGRLEPIGLPRGNPKPIIAPKPMGRGACRRKCPHAPRLSFKLTKITIYYYPQNCLGATLP